jgi:hypothetical protein
MVGNMRCDGRRVGDYEALGATHRNKGMVRSGTERGKEIRQKYAAGRSRAQWSKE